MNQNGRATTVLPVITRESSIIRRLKSNTRLEEHELDLVWTHSRNPVFYSANSLVDISSPSRFFLSSGWACRQWIGEDGSQQIIDFILPGDVILPMQSPKHSSTVFLVALTAISLVSASAVFETVADDALRYTGLKSALAFEQQLESERLINQVVRLGALQATERLADLLAEFHRRLRPVHLANRGRFECPLTQSVFADALGTSAIHMNRTFKLLERSGKITRKLPWIYLEGYT